jgi:hypothetical protein
VKDLSGQLVHPADAPDEVVAMAAPATPTEAVASEVDQTPIVAEAEPGAHVASAGDAHGVDTDNGAASDDTHTA